MKIEESKHSVAELIDLYKRKDLTVNEEYQRAPRLWPSAARSYFIDTILTGYPFPKIYIQERLNRTTMRPQREIVDGQQRMMSIIDFYSDRFSLGNNSTLFKGKRFSQLTEEEQERFLTYTVSLDVIRNAQKAEILQMFRRMNAYTLPLNDAEKRHSEFHGVFKDWVNRLVDEWGGLLAEWKILSSRSIVRMEDAEFFAEIAFAIEQGVKSSSSKQLRDLYAKYDTEFPEADIWSGRIWEALLFISTDLSVLQGTHMTKSYVFLSLVVALLHNKWGIPGFEQSTGAIPLGEFVLDKQSACEALLELASAHETKDVNGPLGEYVAACIGGSNRVRQRTVRIASICVALWSPI
jgi:hypothetical protein